MKLTVIADSKEQMNPVERAINGAGLSIVEEVMLDKETDCTQMEQCDAYILACNEVSQRVTDVLCMISERCHAPVLVVTNDERDEAIDASVKSGASAYMIDTRNLSHLSSVLKVASVRHAQMQALLNELADAKSALAQRKTIERAKGIIMKQRGMDEDSAYRAIRKLAMDNNQKMHEVASQIITAAEVLT